MMRYDTIRDAVPCSDGVCCVLPYSVFIHLFPFLSLIPFITFLSVFFNTLYCTVLSYTVLRCTVGALLDRYPV